MPPHHSFTTRRKARLASRQMVRISLASERHRLCIDPLDPEQHPRDGLANIVTGEVVYHPSVQVDQAVALGKQQCEDLRQDDRIVSMGV